MINANPKATVLNTNTYYVAPKDLIRAKSFTDKVTGKVVELHLTDKMVLIYLIDKVSFHNEQGRAMFESMPAIAEELGVSFKTVQRSVKKLVDHHVVYLSTKSASKGNVYKSIDLSQSWNVCNVGASNAARSKPNPINLQAPVSVVQARLRVEEYDDIPEWCKEAVDAPQSFRDDLEDYPYSDYDHSHHISSQCSVLPHAQSFTHSP